LVGTPYRDSGGNSVSFTPGTRVEANTALIAVAFAGLRRVEEADHLALRHRGRRNDLIDPHDLHAARNRLL
jgi:hypothetical protein